MISLKGPFSAHLRRAWVGVLGCVAASAVAAPQNSASYSATSDTMDAGGRRSTSANYTNDGSVGGIVGISTATAPAASAIRAWWPSTTSMITPPFWKTAKARLAAVEP